MTKGSPPRTSKADSERHNFNRELLRSLAVIGFDQSVILYILTAEPKPGKQWPAIVIENAGAKFADGIKIFIGTENYEKYTPIKKIYIHDENVTHLFLDGLNNCLEKFATITNLQLKSCQLTIIEMESLHILLKKNQNIINLNLDRNPVPEQIHGRLIYETNLKYLSLKHCKINDKGAKILSKYMICNRRLLVLDLSSNFIDDKAAEHLATMLRQNRKLKSLVLTDNWITDIGCKSIMQAFQKFPLNYTEMYFKRQLAFKYYHQRKLLLEQMQPPLTSRISSPKSIAPKQTKRSSKTKPKKSKTQSQKIQYASIKHLIEADYENDKQIQDYLDANVPKSNHPFFSNITHENDNIYCTGNLVLIFLSLAYNKITKSGYAYMIEVFQYQLLQTVASSRLMYIILNGNFDLNSTEAKDVNILLQEQQSKISNGRSGESLTHGRFSLH